MILFKVLIDYPSTLSTDCMLDMCLTYDKILILSSGANKVLEIHIDAEYIKNYWKGLLILGFNSDKPFLFRFASTLFLAYFERLNISYMSDIFNLWFILILQINQ